MDMFIQSTFLDSLTTINNEDIRFYSKSEVDASKLIEKFQEMFPRYYMESNVISRLKSLTIHWGVVTRHQH